MRTLDEEMSDLQQKCCILKIEVFYYLEYNHEDWKKEAGDELPYLKFMFFVLIDVYHWMPGRKGMIKVTTPSIGLGSISQWKNMEDDVLLDVSSNRRHVGGTCFISYVSST